MNFNKLLISTSILRIYYNGSSELMENYTCGVCKKGVLDQHTEICCHHCNEWVHIKCNYVNDLDHNLLKSKNEFWYCILCTSEMLPFCVVISIIFLPKGNLNKLTGALISLMNQLSNSTDD